jgi:hypothetical protein
MTQEERQKEAQKNTRRITQAYRSVFGSPDARTEAQKIVMEDMRRRGHVNSRIFVLGPDHTLCPLRAAWADGARGFVLETIQLIEVSITEDKPKPKVKKT